MYNDYWMMDNGYMETPVHGDLRDLIARPYQNNDTIVMRPDETLADVYQRMKLYDVSQLPVMADNEIVGIIDESDVLLTVFDNAEAFNNSVTSAMTDQLEFLDVKAEIKELLPVFEAGRVAIVKQDNEFLGLITRIDLLNYLRRSDQNQ